MYKTPKFNLRQLCPILPIRYLIDVSLTHCGLGDSMKKWTWRISTALIVASSIFTSTSPASAYWAWGPTWTSPAATRYLYIWGSSWTASQESAISAANMKYDSSNTNTQTSGTTGSSTLNISGMYSTSSLSAFENAQLKMSYVAPELWVLSPNVIAFTCRSGCSDFQVVHNNLLNSANISMNGNYHFVASFSLVDMNVDLQTIALHELGHAHGLGHPNGDGTSLTSAESVSVMNFTFTTKRSLTTDDIYGLESIY